MNHIWTELRSEASYSRSCLGLFWASRPTICFAPSPPVKRFDIRGKCYQRACLGDFIVKRMGLKAQGKKTTWRGIILRCLDEYLKVCWEMGSNLEERGVSLSRNFAVLIRKQTLRSIEFSLNFRFPRCGTDGHRPKCLWRQ